MKNLKNQIIYFILQMKINNNQIKNRNNQL